MTGLVQLWNSVLEAKTMYLYNYWLLIGYRRSLRVAANSARNSRG